MADSMIPALRSLASRAYAQASFKSLHVLVRRDNVARCMVDANYSIV
jgi:hypothetical protein